MGLKSEANTKPAGHRLRRHHRHRVARCWVAIARGCHLPEVPLS